MPKNLLSISTLLPAPTPAPLPSPKPGGVGRQRMAVGWFLTLLLLLLSGITATTLAQTPPPECSADEKFANTWYFGFKAGLDFNQATDSIPPTLLNNSAMDAPAGSGVMSDGNGKILFYSNGETVWNGDGSVMTNGTGLAGNVNNTDGALPIRKPGLVLPGQPTRYLLFTLNSTAGLSYSEIEIPAGGGPGTVLAANKNTPLASGTAEKLSGVFHKNGCDIWVIVHGWGDAKSGNDNRGDAFLAYRVRVAGVDATPIISTVGSLHAPSESPVGYKGQMKITPDGGQLALARYSEVVGDSSSTVELFNFDTGTGQVSANPQTPFIIDSGEGKYYGIEFVPGSKLYATVMNPPKLLQFNISGQGPLNRQEIPLTTSADLGSMQAAPDGKIYVARNNQATLGFIPYPDSVGAAIGFAEDSLQLGTGRTSGLGLPNFNQSSLLRVGFGGELTECRTIRFSAPPIDFDNKQYAWDFGDGTTSTEENPTHTFPDFAEYTVTLRITTDCFCRESRSLIRIPNLPVPGTIAGPQTVCAGSAPAALTATDATSDAGLPVTYQWEISTDNSNFTPIGGATAASYTPAGLQPGTTTYFRRRAQLLLPSGTGPYCAPTFTAPVAVTVVPTLAAGTVAADQTVCTGSTPAPLTSTAAATGGTGQIAYQWESSIDNGTTWTAVAGATGETLTPGAATVTTQYRRQAISGPCNVVSNPVTITVTPPLVPGSIAADQSICSGATPAPLTSAAPATGGAGAVAYQWESSTDNTTWTALPGATGETFASGALTATTYFRRQASAGTACAPAVSNVLTITVAPALVAGAIGADQTLCAGATPAPLTNTTDASGGAGAVSYQWESSTDNNTWAAIPNATGATYAPGVLAATTYFRRQVTSASCAPAVSNVVTLTVLPELTAGGIAANQTICAGVTPAPLTSTSAATGGTGQFAYLWEYSTDNTTWIGVVGATGETFAPGALTTTTSFRRQVTAGACGPVSSNVVTVTVTPTLVAGTIAADQTICAGSTPAPLTSTVATGGTGTYAYQWESSLDNATWTAIGGATGATYAPGALTATTYFRRQVSSGACAATASNVVTITVTPALTAGTIAADQAICAGSTVAPLTSSAAPTGGTGQFAYQWESSSNNTTWTAIPGATGAEYAPGALTATTYFRRQVSSGACAAVTSNTVTITVTPALTAGGIAASQTLCAGSTPAPLTSTGAATGGNGTIDYQWESSADNTTWVAIGGATGPNYVPGQLTATTYFRRRATSGPCGPVVSNVVTITVTPALTAGSIAADQTLCSGATPTPLISATAATGGTGTFAYQWESSANNSTWTAIAGATGNTYAPGPLTATTYFRRQVTSGACGPVVSNVVTLTVLPTLTAGSIAADQTICANATPTPLTSTGAAAGGTGTFAFQWEASADNVNWTAIAGATGDTYAPGALTATTYFRRRVTSGTGTCSTVVSNVVTIRVQPLVTPTVTVATPPVQCPGTPLTFTAVATNAGAAPTYQWFVNNTAVANGPTFTSSTLATGDQVRVEVTPTAGLCSTAPAVATVTVTRTPTPTPTLAIAAQPSGPVCAGEPITFNIASVTEAGPIPTYQWLVDGNPVATGPVFTSSALRAGQVLTLRLTTTNSCGQPVTVTSNGVPVQIQPPVDVDAGPDKEILAGSSVTLEGRADGTYPVTWTPATGLFISPADPLRPTASPTVTTTYRLSAGSGGCADFDEVTVTVRPPIRIPNAFTPNGDGRDDTWQIEFIEQFPDNTVTVYNRWGTKIFSAENYSRANEWRGDINGQPAPVGTYYYVVVTKGPLGRSYSGSITILY
ncbi:gliding motility-associated C-terminal domain-containing protein [Hymenobacter aerilatus]|uniref:Gliding motility-associated C-terminal domain-containing protein n=1 Tax=Hymenobacter aerilatus TaxID=2932251 RepID=A0A8T9SSS0_9BACT|nr:gliding motility-associated C-terminal domain-containing protein [Hymenobacter aerilatus]UOR05182.1 gliding motility-associated C-terminal domain-containing protein [Hymenobacter aerilatus]